MDINIKGNWTTDEGLGEILLDYFQRHPDELELVPQIQEHVEQVLEENLKIMLDKETI